MGLSPAHGQGLLAKVAHQCSSTRVLCLGHEWRDPKPAGTGVLASPCSHPGSLPLGSCSIHWYLRLLCSEPGPVSPLCLSVTCCLPALQSPAHMPCLLIWLRCLSVVPGELPGLCQSARCTLTPAHGSLWAETPSYHIHIHSSSTVSDTH